MGAAPGLDDPDRSAGVDACGLLGGALAMSGVAESVLSVGNAALGADVRGYSPMAAGSGYRGLDTGTGRPIYNAVDAAGSDSVRTGACRFARTDIERMTVLVSDRALVQLGDLVVGPGTGDRYELGIVAGTTGTPAARASAGSDARVQRV